MKICILSRVVMLTMLMATTACAVPQPATSWQKTGADSDSRRADAAACRAIANKEVDREFERQGDFGQSDPFGDRNTWRGTMSAYDAKKRQATLYEQCMRNSGYQKVKIGKP